jgi:hypothetical protein
MPADTVQLEIRYVERNTDQCCGGLLRPPFWIFENLKDSPWWSEVGHQISKRSVERLKSYRGFKNPRWPLAFGRHLGYF